jgi:hypothetical protein
LHQQLHLTLEAINLDRFTRNFRCVTTQKQRCSCVTPQQEDDIALLAGI